MYFARKVQEQLIAWKEAKIKKPIILMGARQVGKTTLLKDFGELYYNDVAYFNFEKDHDLDQLFRSTKDPKRLLETLSLIYGKRIEPATTLIIFDEIQECRAALTSLKYFAEDIPEYSITAAGSLLGLTLGHDASFPVGKVQFINMHPLSFEEFLKTADDHSYNALQYYVSEKEVNSISDIFFNPLSSWFRQYLICGGMPEVAAEFLKSRNITTTQEIQNNIINAYKLDFAKHATGQMSVKINYIWNSIPSQLAKENKKFLYKTVRTGARAREYESALLWLDQAGLIKRAFNVKKPAIPLKAYHDLSAFKIFLFDVGLLGRLSGLNPQLLLSGHALFSEFKGALSENYIAQCLSSLSNDDLHYWTSDGRAEVDFIINYNDQIIPIEVKSNLSLKSKSLGVYKSKYKPKIRLRFSMANLTIDDDLMNIPFFLADKYQLYLDKLI